MNDPDLANFTDIFDDVIDNSQESQPLSFPTEDSQEDNHDVNILNPSIINSNYETQIIQRPAKGTGQYAQFRSVDEIDAKYRSVFSYPFFNVVQSSVIEDALYSDKSIVVCAPTGSGKTVVFEMAIVQLLMQNEDKHYKEDFKIIYMAPVKALCTERLTEWYPKFTKLGLLCIEVTGDTDVDFSQLKPYRIIITTPEKWDMVTRRWREHRQLVEVIKLFLIDEVHILNDEARGPVLEAVVSRMKTIESSAQSAHRIEQLQKQYQGTATTSKESPPKIRFVAVSATVSNPEDVAAWLGTSERPAVYYKFGDESRPVKLKRVVEGYHCPEGTSIFKFDIILNYKLWPLIQKYHNGKPTLIFCNTRKSVALTAETLSRELTVAFNPEQKAKLIALASTIKNKKLQALVLNGIGCHHAGLLFEERNNIERAFRNRDLPILITTTTLAMGVNLPAHLVIIKNTQQYVNGAYQEYSISTILQMVGRAGRPQFDTEATAVIMTRLCDKPRYQALVGGSEPLQSYLHKRLPENLNSEAALGTVNDVAQCVQWLRSTFLCVRAARDPKRYLGLTQAAPQHLISKKIEELCVKAMNGLASSGLITMDEASCIRPTEAGRLMSIFYLDLETMKHIMKINGSETLENLLSIVCESHELADMHLRVDERRVLNALNRNNAAMTIRFPMKGKISTRQMKLNCIIQAVLGCLPITDPSLNQEAMKVIRIAVRVCKCLVTYITRPALISLQPKFYSAVLNSLILAKCMEAHLWENSPFVSKQLKGIGPTFSTLLATAGKVNFMLLEESHPRDLERIMNKGPPSGNVLRKQVSLLPKYQLTMTHLDEKSVTLQLLLLNKNDLAENTDNLTAGDCHKSYIVVGDSDNNLLLLTSFKDKDLINIYDGIITHQITRHHSFEHNVFAHCISSTFVGIDVQHEYLFKNLEPFPFENPSSHFSTNGDFTKKSQANKQTTITDTFKERKRKIKSEIDVAQSKEKKKRDTAIVEKFKCLKASLGKTSKELRDDLDKSAVMSNKILQELAQLEKPVMCTEMGLQKLNLNSTIDPVTNIELENTSMHEIHDEVFDLMDDEKINNMLNEIENEISKSNITSDSPLADETGTKNVNVQSTLFKECSKNTQKNSNSALENYKTYRLNTKKRTKNNTKSNYKFIDLLEKNIDISDEEENSTINKTSGFSDAIKSQVEKYIQQTKAVSTISDKSIEELIGSRNQTLLKMGKVETDARISNIDHNLPSNKINDESASTLQYKTGININTSSKRNAEVNSLVHKEKTENDHRNQTVMNLNNTIDKAVGISSPYHLDQITNYKVEKLFPTNNTPLYENTSDLNIINEKQYNMNKTDDLFKNTNALVPVGRSTIDANRIASVSCLNTLLTDLTTEYPSTTVLALPTPQYSFDKSGTNDHIIVNEEDIINSKSDVNIQPICSKFTHETESKPEETVSSSDSNTHKQNMDIRKYSYSTTKVDIATKNAPDHVVRVIRRMKMDVDITEIISRQNKESVKLPEINASNKINDNSMGKYMNSRDEHTTVNRRSVLEDLESSKLLTSAKENEKNKLDTIPFTKRSICDTVDNSAFSLVLPGKNDDQNSEALAVTQISPQLNVHQKQQNIPEYEKKDVNETDSKIHAEASKMDKNTQQRDDRIKNILKKYSQILSKNNNTENLTQRKCFDKGLSTSLPEKPKRPFKITEINNVKTNLPNILISEISQEKNNQAVYVIEQNDNNSYQEIESHEKINYQRVKRIEQNVLPFGEKNYDKYQVEERKHFLCNAQPNEFWKSYNTNKTQSEDMYDKNVVENVADCEFAITTEEMDLRPSEIDFHIDQSMLNPKTLLQSLNNEETEVIIPPPPEFRDESVIISSRKLPEDDHGIPTDCYEPLNWSNFLDYESVYQEGSRVALTPSEELETWTLSQNDESYEKIAESAIYNPTQCFTIKRNSGHHSSPFQNVSVQRQNRLKQFKFSPKRKLMHKK